MDGYLKRKAEGAGEPPNPRPLKRHRTNSRTPHDRFFRRLRELDDRMDIEAKRVRTAEQANTTKLSKDGASQPLLEGEAHRGEVRMNFDHLSSGREALTLSEIFGDVGTLKSVFLTTFTLERDWLLENYFPRGTCGGLKIHICAGGKGNWVSGCL